MVLVDYIGIIFYMRHIYILRTMKKCHKIRMSLYHILRSFASFQFKTPQPMQTPP